MEKALKIVTPKTKNNNSNDGYKKFLRNIKLFSEFDDFGIDKLLENSTIKEHKKDKLLFMMGDKAEYFYIIFNGWIKLCRETQDGHESVISVLTHADIFGKTAIIKNSLSPYTAEAITNVTIFQIPASFLTEMAKDHTHYDHLLLKMLKSQIEESNQRYLEAEHLAKMTSAERVGCFLLRMCGGEMEGSTTIEFPYEKSLVAGRLGMTPETFSRSLNQLIDIGVETDNSMVTIHNIAQLRARICSHCSAMEGECCFGEDDVY